MINNELKNRFVKNPKFIGLYIEQDDYDILAETAVHEGRDVSKLVREILSNEALRLEKLC